MLRSLLLLLGAAWGVWAAPQDRTSVTVEKRADRDWYLLEAQVTVLAPVGLERLAAVVQDYDAYPQMFPKIREVHTQAVIGAVLLTEKVVVDVLSIHNVNLFTLRMNASRSDSIFVLSWTQESTDGSIDSLEGSWTLEARGSDTLVTYRARSAIPSKIFGQDFVLRMVLGGETRAVVDAVVKAARSH